MNDEIGSFPKDKVAAPIGVEGIHEEREMPDYFDASIEGNRAPGDTKCPVVERVEECKPV